MPDQSERDIPVCYKCNQPIFGGKEHTYDHAYWHPDCLADHLTSSALPQMIRGRDEVYGKPRPRHRAVTRMFSEWQQVIPPGGPIDEALQHAVYLIIDKLTRIAVSPLKEDNWIDIKGYAECGLESLEEICGPLAQDLLVDEEIRELQAEGKAHIAKLQAELKEAATIKNAGRANNE